MVAEGTRKARATSGVVNPPRQRKVSAIRSSSASAGCEQVKQLHVEVCGVAQSGGERDRLPGLRLGQGTAERAAGGGIGGEKPAGGGGYDRCQIVGHGSRSLGNVLACVRQIGPASGVAGPRCPAGIQQRRQPDPRRE